MTTMERIISLIHTVGSIDKRLANFIATSRVYKVVKWSQFSDDPNLDKRAVVSDIEDADVVSSSYVPEGYSTFMHRPVLDLDLDAVLVPSSTPGHHHLYIDKPMRWEDYVRLLDVLASVGILEPGFVNVSKQRGATMVRLPWVKK